MSDMKCPFCQQKLQETYDGKQFWCSNYKDPTHPINMFGTEELWQELIRTRKALDVAMGFIEKVRNNEDTPIFWIKVANNTIAEITALEQKDKK